MPARQRISFITSSVHTAQISKVLKTVLDLNDLEDPSFQRIQLCSTATNVPVMGARTGPLIVRVPALPKWKPLDFHCPPLTVDRSAVEYVRFEHTRLRKRRSWWDDESNQTRTLFSWPHEDLREHRPDLKLRWAKTYPKWLNPGPGDLFNTHAFEPKHGATPGLQGKVTEPLWEALAHVRSLKNALEGGVCPEVAVQFWTARDEVGPVYFFEFRCGGEVVMDGLVDPAFTQ